MPALVNAHDHARPLSPTSFGAAGKPLETWLLRLAAMPAIDPYLGALAAFGRAARGGAGSVMAHYTRFHGPMSPVEEARELARAAADVGVRVTLAVFMRDRNPLVYGPAADVLAKLPDGAREHGGSAVPSADAGRRGTDRARRSDRRGGREPDLLRAIRAERTAMVFGRAARGDRQAVAARQAGACTCIFWRRAISALSPTAPILREWSTRLKALGLLSPAPDARPLRPCARRRARRHRRGRRDHRHQPELEPASGQRRRADFRGDPARLPRRASASTPRRSTRTTTSCAKCGSAISCTAAGDSRPSSRAGDWLARTVANGRFANGAPGDGALQVGAPADILVLDLDRLDRDAVMPVEPIDLVFARANAAHVAELVVAGERIVRDGRLVRADLDAAEAALRRVYRDRIGSKRAFLEAWGDLEPAVIEHYRSGFGCC